MRTRLYRTACIGIAMLSLNCSGAKGTEDDDNSQGGSGYTVPGTAGGQGSGVSTDTVTFTGSSGGDCRISVDGTECAGIGYEPEYPPLDIYVMFDQTGSMCSCVDPPLIGNPCPDPSCKKTRIEAIREAMSEFLADPQSVGIGIGVGYFGQFPIGSADCRDSTYASPAVTIGSLPNNANAMMTSLFSVAPTGETPTAAAIRGACSYAKSWKGTHMTHEVVILLVTDGLPEAPVSCPTANCCPTLDDAVTAAQSCVGDSPRIRTYVLGVGPYLENLQQIATAGGTSTAYLVGTGDVSNQVLQALNKIRGAAQIPCSLKIPSPPTGQQLTYDHVNIAYANANCEGVVYPYVRDAASCGTNVGWYYDNASAPTRVELCAASCAQVSLGGSRFLFTMGCETVDTPIVN